MDYAEYPQVYNSVDHRELVRRFCTDDLSFEAGAKKSVFRGKEGVLGFLLSLQDGVRDVLRAQIVLQARITYSQKQTWTSMPRGASRNFLSGPSRVASTS